MDRVPIVREDAGKFLLLPDTGQDNRLLRARHTGHLTANGKKQTSLLLVIIPRIPVLAVDIALIPAHCELIVRGYLVGDDNASVVDPTVPAWGNAVFHLQLEITWAGSAPDDERIAFNNRFGCDLSHHYAIRHTP